MAIFCCSNIWSCIDCIDFPVGSYSRPIKEKLDDWYHGTLDRMEAISLIHQHGDLDGSFLVRLSERHDGIRVLTMMYNKQAYHFQIQKQVSLKIFNKKPETLLI